MARFRLRATFARTAGTLAPIALIAGLAACGSPPPPAVPATTPGALSPAPPRKPKKAKVEQPTPPPSDAISIEALLDVHRANGGVAIGPDRFLFLSDAPGSAQIFVGKLGTDSPSEPIKLTSFPDRVTSMRMAPDGKAAIFLKDAGGDENYQLHWLDITPDNKPDVTRALTNLPKVRHSLPVFDENGGQFAFTSNARNGKDMDVYIETPNAKAEEFAKKPLVELAGDHAVMDFADNMLLVLQSHSNVNQDIWVIDAKKGTKKLLTKHTGDEGWSAPRFTKDRKGVFAISDRGREFKSLVAVDIASGKVTPVLAGDHDIQVWAKPAANKIDHANKGNEVVVVATNVDGIDKVSVVSIDEKRKLVAQKETELQGVVTNLDVGAEGNVAFVSLENAAMPPEVFRLELPSGKSARATFSKHTGVDSEKLVQPEILSFKSSDGKTISLFYFQKKPAEGEKRPVVVMVHGGPESQAQPYFNPMTQYLVLAGYAVAAPNVRGSTGYGKTFTHLDDKEKREDSVRDLSEVGKFVAARPDVDPARIALYGGSYGGYMVLAGLTLYPEQWAAGIDIVGIANFRTFLEQTAPYRRANREAEYGSLAKDAALLDKISPIHKLDKIKVPVMVIHGVRDPRVPIGEAKQVAEGLQKRGLPTQLMTFPDEGHGLVKRANRLVAYPAMVKFLDEHLKPKGTKPAP